MANEDPDEKDDWSQGWMAAQVEELKNGQKKLLAKIEDHDRRFDTIISNFENLGKRLELFEREMKKINDRLDGVEGQLTDPRPGAEGEMEAIP